MELVKYIPQTYLEKVCTETEPGQKSEFQRELRKVIFSHIDDANRLGKESLDELIDYKTEELVEKLSAYRQEVSRLNAELAGRWWSAPRSLPPRSNVAGPQAGHR